MKRMQETRHRCKQEPFAVNTDVISRSDLWRASMAQDGSWK